MSGPSRSASVPPEDLDQIVTSACRQAGITPVSVRLLRHFANAVYLIEGRLPVVARVAYNTGVVQRSRTAVAVSRWLVSQGFPATTPIDLPSGCPQPIIHSEVPAEVAVTFWSYYAQPAHGPRPTLEELAQIARSLHDIGGLPPLPLPTYEPLRSMRREVADSHLDEHTLSWLWQRIDQLRDRSESRPELCPFPPTPRPFGGRTHPRRHVRRQSPPGPDPTTIRARRLGLRLHWAPGDRSGSYLHGGSLRS